MTQVLRSLYWVEPGVQGKKKGNTQECVSLTARLRESATKIISLLHDSIRGATPGLVVLDLPQSLLFFKHQTHIKEA